jgi:alkylated DNA repair protein (DNA oxidative demethylase)
MRTLSLFPDPTPIVDGFLYRDDIIDTAEEAALIEHFDALPFAPFDLRGFKGHRETVAFGSRFDFTQARVRDAAPIPDWLAGLKASAANFAGLPDEDLHQALVTRYAPGAGIGWRRDRPEYGKVVGVSLSSACVLRLRRLEAGRWLRRAADLAPRSAYLLDGPVRDDWRHSIVPAERLRYSVTVRTLR